MPIPSTDDSPYKPSIFTCKLFLRELELMLNKPLVCSDELAVETIVNHLVDSCVLAARIAGIKYEITKRI